MLEGGGGKQDDYKRDCRKNKPDRRRLLVLCNNHLDGWKGCHSGQMRFPECSQRVRKRLPPWRRKTGIHCGIKTGTNKTEEKMLTLLGMPKRLFDTIRTLLKTDEIENNFSQQRHSKSILHL